jgi:hypothetical protein
MKGKFITSENRLRVSIIEIVLIPDRLPLTEGRAEIPERLSLL